MKKKSLLLFCLIACTCIVYAKPEKISGEIISKNGIRKVVFEVPVIKSAGQLDYQKIQSKITYFDSTGKKFTLRPDTVQEIRLNRWGKTIRMVALYDSIGLGSMFSQSEYVFLKLEMEGKVNVFRYYYSQGGAPVYNSGTGTMRSPSYSADGFILQNIKGELMRPSWMNFRKDMKVFFADCTILTEKIQNKEYDKNDVLKIVEFYNSSCQ
jgi:hypothetical protein